MLSQEHPPVFRNRTGGAGGVEPLTSAFTEPRAIRDDFVTVQGDSPSQLAIPSHRNALRGGEVTRAGRD